MAEARLTSNGRIILPRTIRRHLQVHPGDDLEFVIRDDGEAIVRPVRDVTGLKGLLPGPAEPVSLEEIDRAVRSRAAKPVQPRPPRRRGGDPR